MLKILRTKIQRSLIRAGLVLFFCLFWSTCFALSSSPTTIKGKVTASGTNQALNRASVGVTTTSGKLVASVYSTSSGNYIVYTKNISSGYYVISASLQGYERASITQYIRKGKAHTFNLSLVPQAQSSVPPKISKVDPQDGSRLYVNEPVSISVVTDVADSGLEYRFLIANQEKQAWSPTYIYNWKPTVDDLGIHKIRIEVRNQYSQDAREVEVCILIKPLSSPK